MPRRRQRKMTLVEWLIVVSIAGILFSMSAPSRHRARRHPPRITPVPAAAPRTSASPVALPDTAKTEHPRVGGVWLSRGAQELIAIAVTFLLARTLRKRLRPMPRQPAKTPSPPPP